MKLLINLLMKLIINFIMQLLMNLIVTVYSRIRHHHQHLNSRTG